MYESKGLSGNDNTALNNKIKSLTTGISPDLLNAAMNQLRASGIPSITQAEAQEALSHLSPADVADAFATIKNLS